MPVTVSVRSYTHSVTYVTENILKSLKDIIRLSGLDPGKLTSDWVTLENGLRTWINTGHLTTIHLEIYTSSSSPLVGRWDIEISYGYTAGDGSFWTDTDQIRYAIQKAGVMPSASRYAVIVTLKPNYQTVPGWGSTTLRSTAGFVEQRIGTTVEASGLSGSFSYYRRA
jgi:hypothetical protein